MVYKGLEKRWAELDNWDHPDNNTIEIILEKSRIPEEICCCLDFSENPLVETDEKILQRIE